MEMELLGCFCSPLRFVMLVFPWGEPGPLENYDGPDLWQTQTLLRIEQAIREGLPLGSPSIRLAIASGHGIGKTALVAWLILWFISTRPRPQIVVTANTKNQLTTKTWRELAKWKEMAAHGHWFEHTGTQLKLKAREATWFATAVPWSAANASAFAGTHEEHVLMIFDEASEIDRIIWETAEGAMTTPGAMWFCFGNPTVNTGRFRECWTRFRTALIQTSPRFVCWASFRLPAPSNSFLLAWLMWPGTDTTLSTVNTATPDRSRSGCRRSWGSMSAATEPPRT
jgi:hypothetical protein